MKYQNLIQSLAFYQSMFSQDGELRFCTSELGWMHNKAGSQPSLCERQLQYMAGRGCVCVNRSPSQLGTFPGELAQADTVLVEDLVIVFLWSVLVWIWTWD